MVTKSPISRTRAKALARLMMRVDPALGYTQALAAVAQRLGYANVHAMTAAYAGAPVRAIETVFSHDADVALGLTVAASPSGLLLLRTYKSIPVAEILQNAGVYLIDIAAPVTDERREALAAALRDGTRLIGVGYAFDTATQDATLLDVALRRVLGIDLPENVTLVAIDLASTTSGISDLFPAIMDIRYMSFAMTVPVASWRSIEFAPEVLAYLSYPTGTSEPDRQPSGAEGDLIRVSDIAWDTDGEDPAALELPTELVIDTVKEGISDPDEDLDDWLSNRYGWCVTSFASERVAHTPAPDGDASSTTRDFSKVRPRGTSLTRDAQPFIKTLQTTQALADFAVGHSAGERADGQMRINGPSPRSWERVSAILKEGPSPK